MRAFNISICSPDVVFSKIGIRFRLYTTLIERLYVGDISFDVYARYDVDDWQILVIHISYKFYLVSARLHEDQI